jgi:hypothetical protein
MHWWVQYFAVGRSQELDPRSLVAAFFWWRMVSFTRPGGGDSSAVPSPLPTSDPGRPGPERVNSRHNLVGRYNRVIN